jgi:hypothetical protein
MSDTLTTGPATGPALLPTPDPADRVDAVLAALRAPGIPAHGWAYLGAEAIRALNHATLTPDAYRFPGEAHAVIGDLASLLQRLSQALMQAGGALEAMDHAGHVVDTRHPGEPAVTSVTVIGVAEDLAETALYVQAATGPLTVAHTQAARLAHTSTRGAGEW